MVSGQLLPPLFLNLNLNLNEREFERERMKDFFGRTD